MILLDFESVSRADLKAIGGRNYAAHASTAPLCAVLFDTETQDVALWQPGAPCPFGAGETLGAHNASGFDRFMWERQSWPAEPTFVDTSELARRAGLPGALDALGTRWLNLPKDKAASAFTKGLSICRRPSGKGPDAILPAVWRTLSKAEKSRRGVQKSLTPDVLERVVAYCASDVEILAHGWPKLRPFLEDGVFAGWEADVLAVDRIVNDRGIAFDSALARRLIAIDDDNQAQAIEAAAKVLSWTAERMRTVVSASAQFAFATGAPNAQAETVTDLARRTTDPSVRALCSARQALATIAGGKLRAGLARVSPDGRLRDMHKYYGAHTGRWSGRGMQVQNLPRPEKRFEDWHAAEIDALCARVMRGGTCDSGEMMIALRATLRASDGHSLCVEDFSGVEARANALCARDRKALDVFASGRNPYLTAAAVIFGKQYEDIRKGSDEYDIGKKSELGCGYGMGAQKFEANYEPSRVGVDAADVVSGWRALHAPIVKFWRDLERAFIDAAHGTSGAVDRFEFVPSSTGTDVAIFLPSGRPIVYNEVGVSRGQYGPQAHYRGQKGAEHLYGGKICENVIQSMCRDMLADALVRAEEAGLCPVLHVHDEIVCDVPASAAEEASAELHEIMLALPEWASDFPVGAAGHFGERYRK